MLVPLLISAALAIADPPVNGNVARPGFVPPVLKGINGDGKARHGDIPLPNPDERWLTARTRHFVFVSAASEKTTHAMAQSLETLAVALSRLNPTFAAARPEPTNVYLFTRRREAQPYFDMLLNQRDANVTGVFVSQKSAASIVMIGGPRQTTGTAFHELVHNLIESNAAQPPLWLDEGLAEYLGGAELRNGSIYAGEPVRHHMEVLRQRKLLPLGQLFAVVRESDTYNLPEGQSVFYAESWAMVDWLMRHSGKDHAAFYAFFRDVTSGKPVDVALRDRYRTSIDDVQRELGALTAFRRLGFGITIKVPDVDPAVAMRPLSRAETLVDFGHFLAGLEEMAPDAERHFRAALVADPHDARATAAIAVLRANDMKYDEAARLFDQALAQDANDPSILLDYAEALMEKQIGAVAESDEVSNDDAPRFRKARSLAEKALALGGDAGRASGDIGTSYLVEMDADLAPGIAALEKAHALLPGRTDFALHLLAMYRRTRALAKADALFAQLDASRNPQAAFVARAIVTRVELDRANRFTHEGKLADAANILRDLAAHTPDAGARGDFEKQADDLLKTDATNRQIDLYNSAVAQVNRGKYAAARKILASIATDDPELTREIASLQKQLVGRKDRR